MSNVRVRYGRRPDRSPKNTLFTEQVGDYIYFGIARCNTKEDRFNRQVGQKIASNRAQLAKQDADNNCTLAASSVCISKTGLRGFVPVSDVKQLIMYFRDIDQTFLRRG